ncbi:Cof-type HAD-IIB family hydrolase [Clostridium sp.]|uniref:Cof-type HAD-IIB family hydrolase n=1 Tax=Clostridium sp. TaxID=1506 RepID=UPI002634B96A|nr:Cof-type HAD-IIB family hydrolase [Clostridium sp.]
MKNNIKLICIDMDGTLLNSNHEVTEENKLILQKAFAKGIRIVLCTGRIFMSARYYSDLIGIKNAPVIASNGAYIKNGYTDKAIYENPMPKDLVLEIYSIIKRYGLKINFNSWNTLFRIDKEPSYHTYYKMNKLVSSDKRINFIINEDLEESIRNFDGEILKGIVIEQDNVDTLWKAKAELKELYGDKLHIVSSGADNFEIMLGSSSKGNAVSFIAKSFNIDPSEVMCIGDSENDLSMIEFAGIGVAMGNGLDLLKEAADYITDTNDNSGVSKAIKKFALENN